MVNVLSIITDKLMSTIYQNSHELTQVNIKDDTLIINLLSKFILPILLIFGFYVHLHGDYTPGGGFQAGIIFACALCLYCFINLNGSNVASSKTNNERKKSLINWIFTIFAIIGFILYTGFGITSFFITGKFLDFTFLPFEHSNARGVFIIELGIAFIVSSSVSRIFYTLLNEINSNQTDNNENAKM